MIIQYLLFFSLVLASIICINNNFYLRIFRNLRIAHEKNKTANDKGYGEANGCKNTNSNIIPLHYLICRIDTEGSKAITFVPIRVNWYCQITA